jgi:hypothetical protein
MKKQLFRTLALLIFLCPIILSACGSDTTTNNNTGETTSGGLTAATPDDLDGDRLSNEAEALLGTSPVLADTDGDGIIDSMEVGELGFDTEVNPYKFNPLVADVPRLGIVLRSPPSITVNFALVDGRAVVFEVDRTEAQAVSVTQSETTSETQAIELAQNTNSTSIPINGVPTDIALSYDIGKTIANEVSFEFSEEQSVENAHEVTVIEAFEESHEVAADGGSITVLLDIENRGNIAFTIAELILSAVIPDPENPGEFLQVQNLILDTSGNYSQYEHASLPPGGVFPLLHFTGDLDTLTAIDLLRDSSNIIFTVAYLELTDADGRPFAFNFTDINARTASIIIDYAGLRRIEKYNVATNADPTHRGITAGRALRDILNVPFETANSASLVGLRNDPNVRADAGRNAFWLAVHTRNNGIGNVVTRYSPVQGDYDFENIQLKAGDTLYLVYMVDADGDGIFSRQEFLLGTSDITADSDGDGWTDFYEANISHTSPTNPDTDGDGVIDNLDTAPLDPGVL